MTDKEAREVAEPYTPTEAEVRFAYLDRRNLERHLGGRDSEDAELTWDAFQAKIDAEFDRFLAQERREALSGYVRKPSREELAAVIHEKFNEVRGRFGVVPLDLADAILLALFERSDR